MNTKHVNTQETASTDLDKLVELERARVYVKHLRSQGAHVILVAAAYAVYLEKKNAKN